MTKKNTLLKECAELLKKPHIALWYDTNLKGKSQYKTIKTLRNAILTEQLSTKEALSIALIVGVQWNIKFEGVP